jgi:uncharacterized membrane protein required for colicin V production
MSSPSLSWSASTTAAGNLTAKLLPHFETCIKPSIIEKIYIFIIVYLIYIIKVVTYHGIVKQRNLILKNISP